MHSQVNEIQIENASELDVRRIKELLRSVELPDGDLGNESASTFLVARQRNRIVGAVAVERHGTSGLLRSLVVETERQGKGLGKSLVFAALTKAKQLNVDEVILLTITAEGFFAKLGFQKMDRNHAAPEIAATTLFRTHCPQTAICMIKAIQSN